MRNTETVRGSIYMSASEPEPFASPQQAMQAMMDRYTTGYSRQDSDVSEESRNSIRYRANPFIGQLGPSDVVLSLGAGKQLLERAYLGPFSERQYKKALRNYGNHQRPDQVQCKIVTIDFADLKREQLAAMRFPNVTHLRASGDSLPLGDNTVSVIISNMALEYMPENALAEAYRVLVSGGKLFANIWTGEEYLEEWDEFKIQLPLSKRIKKNLLQNLSFWYQFVRSGVNSYFGFDITQARKIFESHGFYVEKLKKSGDTHINWWEVDMIKS